MISILKLIVLSVILLLMGLATVLIACKVKGNNLCLVLLYVGSAFISIGIIVIVFLLYCKIVTSESYQTIFYGENVEYAEDYEIITNDGKTLVLAPEHGDRISIILPETKAVLYQEGETITCSFSKRNRTNYVENFVVTDVSEPIVN